ncbi:MAG TPA: PQQ-dependent sugar dehydrogenase [Fimbriimonas sp.]|nr:PQQ-dependent sugar dehydrogenase [Fimbriimonas sp.]
MLTAIALAAFVPVFAGLQSVELATITGGNPLGYYPHPTDRTLAFVVLKNGRILKLKSNVVKNGVLQIPAADMSTSSERGLLGFAFDPHFSSNGYAYIYFNKANGNIQIARISKLSTGIAFDYSSRYDLMNIPHPSYANHNGGTMQFGPDGFLYIGTGDGGGFSDPNNNAQNRGSLLGKMLRIDVNSDGYPTNATKNYAIPPGNPFKGIAGFKPEVFAYGLRNPWKWSFDNGNILIGDVGLNTMEEVDIIPEGTSGQNFGWRPLEGTLDNPNVEDPHPAGAVFPILEYTHEVGRSITGGRVYRGALLGPEYVGRYFFADYAVSRIWSCDPYAADVASTVVEHTSELLPAGSRIVSIDRTFEGELVLVDLFGKIYLIQKKP